MSPQISRELPLAVCAAVIRHQGKILLTQRLATKAHGGYWEFPGGKIEPQESPHQTLKRELQEELAIEISPGSILETVFHYYDWGSVLIIAYLCSWEGGEIKHLEVADHAWVTLETLPGYQLLPADQPILEKLRKLASG